MLVFSAASVRWYYHTVCSPVNEASGQRSRSRTKAYGPVRFRTVSSRRGRSLGEALSLLEQAAPPDPAFAEDMEAVLEAIGPAPADPWELS